MVDNTTLNAGSGGDVIATDDIAGVKHQRVKIEHGADGSATDVSNSTPLPTFDRHDGRTLVQLYATAVASGTTGTETAILLAKAGTLGSAPAAAAASLVPPTGKRFRITSITFASRGNATATAQVTTFNIRVNAGGAVTTGALASCCRCERQLPPPRSPGTALRSRSRMMGPSSSATAPCNGE
jgi:hypothetical protein